MKSCVVYLMQVVQLFSCLDKISYIEWALDSEYILCGLYKRPMIQAWSLTQPEWTCKIDEGPAGIAYARWSPDSRHILTTSDFQLRLTVWSLVNTACVHVQWPKHASKGVSFTKDGKFAAICTRRDCKDYINLLSCCSWEIMGAFAVDTLDLADIEWSPDDSAIVMWDSSLEYKVVKFILFIAFVVCIVTTIALNFVSMGKVWFRDQKLNAFVVCHLIWAHCFRKYLIVYPCVRVPINFALYFQTISLLEKLKLMGGLI